MARVGLLEVLAACSDVGINPIKEGSDGDGPAIEVDPDFLDFGVASKDDDAVDISYSGLLTCD